MENEFYNFSRALQLIKEGAKLSRAGWNGRGMWIGLRRPDHNSEMSSGYLFISIVGGELVPWVASHGDLLAEDWFIA